MASTCTKHTARVSVLLSVHPLHEQLCERSVLQITENHRDSGEWPQVELTFVFSKQKGESSLNKSRGEGRREGRAALGPELGSA